MRRAHARDAFDADIIQRAVLFTAILWQPRGQSQRLEFDTLAEAISAASELRDEFGRTGLVYAISSEGREAQSPARAMAGLAGRGWALTRIGALPLVVFHLRQLPHWLYLDARQTARGQQPMRWGFAVPLLMTLAACATVHESYAPDGRKAYTLNCSGLARGWDKCFSAAGDICKTAGYDILDRSDEPASMASAGGNGKSFGASSASTNERSMVIACKNGQ